MNRPSAGPRNLVGIALIVLGVVFLLDALDVFGPDTNLIGILWPVLIIGVGLWMWAQSGFVFTLGPLIVVTVGVFLLIGSLTDENVWRFWPVLLILIGLSFIWSHSRSPRSGDGGAAIGANDGVRINAFLGGDQRRMTGEFRGGHVAALMGGAGLDLRDALLPATGAVLDVNIIMGSLDVRVPDDWPIDFRTSVLLGGIDDKRRQAPTPQSGGAPVLTVRGSILMGGLNVKP